MGTKEINLALLVLSLSLGSCSFTPSKTLQGSSNKVKVVESEEGVIEFISLDVDEVDEALNSEKNFRSDSIMDAPLAVVAVQNQELHQSMEEVVSKRVKYEEYIIQEGDTLMILAFRMYRDVLKWRDIASWNEELLKGKTILLPGDKLKIKVLSLEGIVWEPQGNPYLVEHGDSLMGISENVYNGYARFWRDIWNNNKLLIRNPNVIYAGFTLYYLPYEEVSKSGNRQLASNKPLNK